MIKTFWAKLDEKQRKLVASAAILVLIALIMEIAVFPLWEAKAKLTKGIQVNQKKLTEISKLDAEFASQEAAMAKIKKTMSARGADFTLFAYLEKKSSQANVRGRIKQMNSSKGIQSISLEESLIDMKLEKITIKQLTDFLYFVESPADLVRIKKITISKMKESPEYLSAQLQISSFQTLNQRQEGNIAK
jgi:general secretion pathway protein M